MLHKLYDMFCFHITICFWYRRRNTLLSTARESIINTITSFLEDKYILVGTKEPGDRAGDFLACFRGQWSLRTIYISMSDMKWNMICFWFSVYRNHPSALNQQSVWLHTDSYILVCTCTVHFLRKKMAHTLYIYICMYIPLSPLYILKAWLSYLSPPPSLTLSLLFSLTLS